MQVSTHPTRIVGRSDPGADAVEWFHAGLWLNVSIAEWDVRRSGHVHVVTRPCHLSAWHPFDIALHPLRVERDTPPPSGETLQEVVTALQAWLSSWPLEVHRHTEIGLVSELGESRADFQRRVMAVVRPELQRRVSSTDETAGSRWPWRRRAAEKGRMQRTERLAAGVAQLGSEIETRAVDSPTDAVRRAEIGVLLCAREIDLSKGRGPTRSGN